MRRARAQTRKDGQRSIFRHSFTGCSDMALFSRRHFPPSLAYHGQSSPKRYDTYRKPCSLTICYDMDRTAFARCDSIEHILGGRRPRLFVQAGKYIPARNLVHRIGETECEANTPDFQLSPLH
jgi:hypothetical protein